MARTTVKLTGFKELEQALVEELPKATAKNSLRRAAIDAMKPLEARAKQLVRKDQGELAARITTKTVRAKRISRTKFESASGVIVATGPTGRPEGGGNAGWQEFGTVEMPASPYMRPAADSEGMPTIDRVRDALTVQIGKARKRIARKAAKGK